MLPSNKCLLLALIRRQGRRKQFCIGQTESSGHFWMYGKVATHRHTGYLYCAKHADAKGSGGIATPQENFEKQVLWDWIWGHFST